MKKKVKLLAVAAVSCAIVSGLTACTEHAHTADEVWHGDENNHWHVCVDDGEILEETKPRIRTRTPSSTTGRSTGTFATDAISNTAKRLTRPIPNGTPTAPIAGTSAPSAARWSNRLKSQSKK